jgi:hypothetical protein
MDLPSPALFEDALDLLKNLIETPSLSKEENKTADLIQIFLEKKEFLSIGKGIMFGLSLFLKIAINPISYLTHIMIR